MTNPYINIQERANYDMSALERSYRRTPENKWIQENLPPRQCVNIQVDGMDSFKDVGEFIGKFNLELALQLAAMKASSYSPANFNDFLPYLDQTIDFFSCIFSANLDTVKNTSPKGKSFDFGAFALSIPFDFLKIYGKALFALLEKLAVEIIKKVFLEILSVVDCDKIDKCIVPCNPNDNPYKKFIVKPVIKESTNTAIFFGQKILDGKFNEKGFDITDKEMQEYAKKAVQRLAPDELECLLNGFMSSDVINFLIELFKDHTGHDVTSREIGTIFNDINAVVDLVPYTPTTIDTNDCGLISLDSVARMRLRREGLTEQQISDRMNLVIQESRGRLTTITNFLRALPAPSPDLGAVSFTDNGREYRNSPITVAVINKSIDLIFDSINVNSTYVSTLLQKLLVYSLGELCLGYYWVNWGEGLDSSDETVGEETIPNPVNIETIRAKIEVEFKPVVELETILLEQRGTDNFYSKYLTNLISLRFGGFLIDITEEGSILVKNENIERFSLIGNTFTDSLDGTTQNVDYSNIPQTYLLSTNRNDLLSILKLYNSEKLFSDTALPVQNEADNILTRVYSNIYAFIDESMSKDFFFQEFVTLNTVLAKKEFSNKDFLNMEVSKERLKEKINA